MNESPLFKSVHHALTFAYNFEGQPERPLMNRMGKGSEPGIGLGGLDGAAQAGFIRAEVEQLGTLAEAIIIARFAPHTLPGLDGSCRRKNPLWRVAISVIADRARTSVLAGCDTTSETRLAYVKLLYAHQNERVNLKKIAERSGIHRNTAQSHARRVREWLMGTKGRGWIAGIEDKAMNTIYDKLVNRGLCEP
ncbi:MAG: hypothetical protein FWH15_07875 [Betaproteobacteria bacterium]|nr:hypothetical protein [Betaproteobacteria bacterium]